MVPGSAVPKDAVAAQPAVLMGTLAAPQLAAPLLLAPGRAEGNKAFCHLPMGIRISPYEHMKDC